MRADCLLALALREIAPHFNCLFCDDRRWRNTSAVLSEVFGNLNKPVTLLSQLYNTLSQRVNFNFLPFKKIVLHSDLLLKLTDAVRISREEFFLEPELLQFLLTFEQLPAQSEASIINLHIRQWLVLNAAQPSPLPIKRGKLLSQVSDRLKTRVVFLRSHSTFQLQRSQAIPCHHQLTLCLLPLVLDVLNLRL